MMDRSRAHATRCGTYGLRAPGRLVWALILGGAGLSLSCGQSGDEGRPATAPAPPVATTPAERAPSDSARPLNTAEIVARCEPSVALIAGRNSSGTGFLVRPGLLATNFHVIEGETVPNLEVRFPSAPEGKRGPYRAELVARDRQRDLAFLAVKSDLAPLEIARSYRFRKGDDITVIGSPGIGPRQVLENAISRGVMSTRATIDGRSFYQLGVAVNPGNSGGPVIDSAGRVIGVVTLKATRGEELAFCVPVEDLAQGIELAARTPTPPEADPAPALAYRWTAGQTYVYSIHVSLEVPNLVQVLDGSSIYTVKSADADRADVAHRGWLITRRRTRDGSPPPNGAVSGPGNPTEVALELDRQGNVLKGEGKLPVALLGDLATLVLEPLPDQPQSSWELAHAIALQHSEVKPGGGAPALNRADLLGGRFGIPARSRARSRLGSPFDRRPSIGRGRLPRGSRMIAPSRPAPRPTQVEVTTIPAHETIRYRVSKGPGGAARLLKNYELTTDAQAGGVPLLTLTAEGTTTFDPKLGMPREVDYQGRIVTESDNVTVRIPFQMTCRLLDGAERSRAQIFPVMPPTPRQPITAEQLDQALAALGSKDAGPRRDAAHRLAEAEPIEARRAEVARALEARLDDRNGDVHREAINALGVWGDSRSRAPLIAHLSDERYDARRELVDALGRLGPDPAAAEAVAACLGAPSVDAGRALRALGAEAAEPPLRSVVEHDGPINRRVEACRLLGQLGTKASLASLRALAGRQADARLAHQATDTVNAIRKRYPGEAELSRLLGDLKSADGRARHDAAVRLAQLGPVPGRRDEVTRAFIELLTDRDGDTQVWSVRGLDAWGAEPARAALVERVADPPFSPWRDAVTLLAKLGQADEATAKAVASRLDQDRGRVLEALRTMGPVAEPIVLGLLDHPDGNVRRDACGVLATVGTGRSVATLEALAADKSVRFLDGAAREALKGIQGRIGEDSELRALVPKLRTREIFSRGDALRRVVAARPTGALRAEIARAIEESLDPREGLGQDELYKALAVLGDDQTRAKLVTLARDPTNRYWKQAVNALMDLGPDEATLREVVGHLKDDPGLVGNAVRKVGKLAEPVLLEAVRSDPDPRNRVEACRLLASLGTPESLPALEPLTQGADLEPLARVAEESARAIEGRH